MNNKIKLYEEKSNLKLAKKSKHYFLNLKARLTFSNLSGVASASNGSAPSPFRKTIIRRVFEVNIFLQT